jgi:hypothetical protein
LVAPVDAPALHPTVIRRAVKATTTIRMSVQPPTRNASRVQLGSSSQHYCTSNMRK